MSQKSEIFDRNRPTRQFFYGDFLGHSSFNGSQTRAKILYFLEGYENFSAIVASFSHKLDRYLPKILIFVNK
jgi:hypothetical protein